MGIFVQLHGLKDETFEMECIKIGQIQHHNNTNNYMWSPVTFGIISLWLDNGEITLLFKSFEKYNTDDVAQERQKVNRIHFIIIHPL